MVRFEANDASGLTEIIRDWVLPLGPRLSVIARPVIARLPVECKLCGATQHWCYVKHSLADSTKYPVTLIWADYCVSFI